LNFVGKPREIRQILKQPFPIANSQHP
jgi:hypothetical protein